MKKIEVVAAVIIHNEQIYATQRGYGEFKDGWEFPGGKIECGETPEQALRREINEELAIEINVDKLIRIVDCDYPSFHLTMHCYFCHIVNGIPVLKEHEAAKWLSKETINTVDWLEADRILIEDIKKMMDW